jgi:uncharacterized phage infection (PIP) family protein YhgE
MRIKFFWVASVIGAAIACGPASAQAPRPECVGLLEDRLKLVNQLNDLDKVELPDDKIRDMRAFMAELKDALSGTASDSKDVAEKIEKAADKIKPYLPNAVKPLKDISAGLKKGTAKIGEVLKPIEQFDKALQYVDDLYSRTEGGTAKDQVLALQKVFDDMRKALPVAEVPGLKDLFDAYSKAIGGIADSVGSIEKSVDASNKTMHQLWIEDGDPNLEGRDRIYLPNMGLRERLAAKKQAAQKKLAAIDGALDAAGCQRPGGPNQPDFSKAADGCFDQKPGSPGHKARVALETAKKRVADLERKIKDSRDRIYTAWELEQKANDAVKTIGRDLDRLQAAVGRRDKDIKAIDAKIAKAKSDQHIADLNAKAGGSDRAKWEAEVRAQGYNIDALDRDRTKAVAALKDVNDRLPAFSQGLEEAKKAAKDAHDLQDTLRDNIGKMRDQLGDAVRKILAQAAAYENWDATDYAQLERCRKRYFDDRVADRITPDKVKADIPKPPPPKPPATTAAPTPCPPVRRGGGGLAGAVEDVSRQIDGANCR